MQRRRTRRPRPMRSRRARRRPDQPAQHQALYFTAGPGAGGTAARHPRCRRRCAADRAASAANDRVRSRGALPAIPTASKSAPMSAGSAAPRYLYDRTPSWHLSLRRAGGSPRWSASPNRRSRRTAKACQGRERKPPAAMTDPNSASSRRAGLRRGRGLDARTMPAKASVSARMVRAVYETAGDDPGKFPGLNLALPFPPRCVAREAETPARGTRALDVAVGSATTPPPLRRRVARHRIRSVAARDPRARSSVSRDRFNAADCCSATRWDDAFDFGTSATPCRHCPTRRVPRRCGK